MRQEVLKVSYGEKSKVKAHLIAPRAGSFPGSPAVNGRGGVGLDHATKL